MVSNLILIGISAKLQCKQLSLQLIEITGFHIHGFNYKHENKRKFCIVLNS